MDSFKLKLAIVFDVISYTLVITTILFTEKETQGSLALIIGVGILSFMKLVKDLKKHKMLAKNSL